MKTRPGAARPEISHKEWVIHDEYLCLSNRHCADTKVLILWTISNVLQNLQNKWAPAHTRSPSQSQQRRLPVGRRPPLTSEILCQPRGLSLSCERTADVTGMLFSLPPPPPPLVRLPPASYEAPFTEGVKYRHVKTIYNYRGGCRKRKGEGDAHIYTRTEIISTSAALKTIFEVLYSPSWTNSQGEGLSYELRYTGRVHTHVDQWMPMTFPWPFHDFKLNFHDQAFCEISVYTQVYTFKWHKWMRDNSLIKRIHIDINV